jgi:hypothetical protein
LTGITSRAETGSTGHAGTINVTVAGDARLLNGGTVSSANEGTGDAGAVNVSVGGRLDLTDGVIATSAQTGNGGPIDINVPLLVLTNGQITTSVLGESGNGGDIAVSGKYLVMDTGFIQANTAAVGAKGGNVFIDELGVIGSGGVVTVGGQERATYVPDSSQNVIQAAAPEGVSGNVTLSSPDTSAAARLVAVADPRLKLPLRTNPCGHKRWGSLYVKGRGRRPATEMDNVLSASVPPVSGTTPVPTADPPPTGHCPDESLTSRTGQ